MRIVYLASARADIAWMRDYYRGVFPEGRKRARERLKAAERLLSAQPRVGHPTGVPDVFEHVIARTPFSLIYRLASDRVEILRV